MATQASDLYHFADAKDFSGVVRVESHGDIVDQFSRGFADRANGRANSLDTRFAVASATKGLTALTAMSLVESGALTLTTTLRSIVGDLLPHVDPAVTIDQVLAHRSGVGDYLDEEELGDIDEYVFSARSAHTFGTPHDYVDLVNQHPQRSAPGLQFAYNNGGYVMLSIVIETLTGSFHRAVNDRVLGPAGMTGGGFFRTDELPTNTALGYLKDGRTNVFNLPVIGAGDGGIYLTLDDVSALWQSIAAGRIVSLEAIQKMTTVTHDGGDSPSYGRGFWMDSSADHIWLEGMDAGVSFQSGIRLSTGLGYTVMSNTSTDAWPVADAITGG